VARAVAAAAGEAQPVQINETPAPGRPLSRYVPSVERAETELGLRVWIPLDEAIRKTMAWQRSARPVLSS
jgi:dTDP-glucose 4,6-dehydratase